MRIGGPRTTLPWTIGAILASLVVVVPTIVIFSSVLRSSDGVWSHLVETRLPAYAGNTAVLTVGVCGLAGIVGVVTAWILSTYRFPGSRFLSWAQLLPLSVPAYLSAYTLADLLQFSGPVQTWIRERLDLTAGEYWFPQIRSVGGAIVVLSFALYPYVYFAARVA
ncbi:MAG: iron ABC transporter permease, partial [Planctomycetota bacterium]|nr:iron ABC transporter permease [Planctomycetota bacterium]